MAAKTKEFLDEEKSSRLAANLVTSESDDKGFYDQVVAVSQRMINAAMNDMYLKNKRLREIVWKIPQIGQMNAELHPPQVILNAANANWVTWVVNFKSGSLIFDEEKKHGIPDLTDWTLAFQADLAKKVVSYKSAGDDPTLVAQVDNEMKEMSKRFIWPEGYDPVRLYVMLSSAFAKQPDETQSYYGKSTVNGVQKRLSLAEYRLRLKEEGKEADYALGFLQTFLIGWVRTVETAGCTVMVTQFQDTSQPVERPATFPPKFLKMQTSPYKLKGFWDKGVTGIGEPADYNCLCYCELVDDQDGHHHNLEPTQEPLPYTGNWVSIGKGVDPEGKYLEGHIEGTFALSRQLLFEKFLLKYFRLLVASTIIVPQAAKFTDSGRTCQTDWDRTYGVGADDEKKLYFSRDKIMATVYTCKSDPLGNGVVDSEIHVNPASQRRYFQRATAKTEVKVTWTPGGTDILIAGSTKYGYTLTSAPPSASSKISDIGRLDGYNGLLKDDYDASWHMTIKILDVEGGDMHMAITEQPTLKVTPTKDSSSTKDFETPTDQLDQISKNLKEKIAAKLEDVQTAIKAAFNNQLKFTYPGNGCLDFGNIIFSNNGDLLADIRYKSIPHGVKVTIPDQYQNKVPVPTPTIPTTAGSGTSNTAPDMKLTWTINQVTKANSPNGSITVTIKNDTSKTLYFKELGLRFSVSSGHTTLFVSNKFLKGDEKVEGSNQITLVERPPSRGKTLNVEVTNPITGKLWFCSCAIKGNEFFTVASGTTFVVTITGLTGKAPAYHPVSISESPCDKNGAAFQESEELISSELRTRIE